MTYLFMLLLVCLLSCNDNSPENNTVHYERASLKAVESCGDEESEKLEYFKIKKPMKVYAKLDSNEAISGKLGLGYYYYNNKQYISSVKKLQEAIPLINNKIKSDHFDLGFKYRGGDGELRLVDKKTILHAINECIKRAKFKIDQ